MPSTTILSLPNEVLESIIDFAFDRLTCKSLRLTCKTISIIATPKLFAKWSLYPHDVSIEVLNDIIEHDSIRHMVRTIELDGRFIFATQMMVKALPKLQNADLSRSHLETLQTIAHTIHKGRLMVTSPRDSARLALTLMTKLPSLTELNEIIVHDKADHSEREYRRSDLPNFYDDLFANSCDLSESTALDPNILMIDDHVEDEHYSLVMLFVMGFLDPPITKLSLTGTHFQKMSENGLRKQSLEVRQPLRHLESLTIRPGGSHRFDGGPGLYNLQILLRAANRLINLDLFLSTIDQSSISTLWVDVVDITGFATTILTIFSANHGRMNLPRHNPRRLIWSNKLKTLRLHGLICSARDAKKVLSHCARSLRKLWLSGLLLLPRDLQDPYDERIYPRACLVRFFDFLSEKMNLEDFKADGDFTNGGLQRWTLACDDYSTKESVAKCDLKGNLQNYVVYKQPSPIQIFAIPSRHFDFLRKDFECVPSERRLQEEQSRQDSRFSINFPAVEDMRKEVRENTDELASNASEDLTDGYTATESSHDSESSAEEVSEHSGAD